MAVKVTIPIENDEDACKSGYIVEYKLEEESEYVRLFPDPLVTPVVIENLLEGEDYNVRIKRKCCNGSESAWTNVNVNTTLA